MAAKPDLPQRAAAEDAPRALVDGDRRQGDEELRQLLLLLLLHGGPAPAPAALGPVRRGPAAAARPGCGSAATPPTAAAGPGPPGALAAAATLAALAGRPHIRGPRGRPGASLSCSARWRLDAGRP